MKAKLIFILVAVASMLTSCNMDLFPAGELEQDTAIQELNDAMRYRNGFYSGIRSFTTSKYFAYADIQADMFNGVVINGNRMGVIANGDVLPSDDDITGYWAALYGLIADINFYLKIMGPLYDQAVADGNRQNMLEYARYIGEAHFFRGYYYAMLFDRWCQQYTPEKGDTPGLGLPIVTVYDPTSDRSKYPGRSTMNETIKFFKDEINTGLEALAKYEETNPDNIKPNAEYLSSYACRAMQARIALWLGEYQDAFNIAQEIISSKIYTLATLKNFQNMWTQDLSSELIFRPIMTKQELSNSIGNSWIGVQIDMADYIPSPKLIAYYEAAGKHPLTGWLDVRYKAYLSTRTLATAYGDIETTCFNKFPGNSDLMVSSTPNLMNMPKPFRLSEIYLIAAESAYMLGNETDANSYLNTLISNRITSYKPQSLSGDALRDAIRTERCKELVGEGFRLSDLRRWHQGFDRKNNGNYPNTPDVNMILTHAGLNVIYDSNDHRYTWPIPSLELQANPQIANQQNPGY